MRTKCKSCLYYSKDKKCDHDILTTINKKIDYDQEGYPEIYDYKCLYAFPNTFKLEDEDTNVTAEDLEKFRISKLPRIKTSIVIDGFKKSETDIKDTIQYLNQQLIESPNFTVSDMTILLCSEQENKLDMVEYLENSNIKIKWKCCALRVCLNNTHKFLFSLQHIDPKSNMVIYVKADNEKSNTQSIIDATVETSLILQWPYVFLHNNSLNISESFDCLSCNIVNLNTLKRHNMSENDDYSNPKLIYEWISRENKPELIINVNE